MSKFLRKNWFLFALAGTVALGLGVPALGESVNRGGVANTLAVMAMFVLLGLSLPSEQMRRGLRNVRVHAYLQGFVFGVVPVYVWLTAGAFAEAMEGRLILGLYALAVLPTTISSCSVFTQMARGNVATSIFNAVLANMAGVVVSPLLLTLLLSQVGRMLPAEEVLRILGNLALKVLVPFVVGQLLRLRVRAFADRHSKRFSTACAGLVLVIVFLAFCRAAGSDLLRQSAADLLWPFAYLAGSNVLLMVLAYAGARGLGFDRSDVAASVFVAPQKTLGMGVPLLTTYFAGEPGVLAVVMLPVLFYHPWQLVTAAVARGLVRVPEASPGPDPGPPAPGRDQETADGPRLH
jgi:sodium/bile acid cotransporter 7